MSGVPITVNALPAVNPTGPDSIPVWDFESGLQGRVTFANLIAFLDDTFPILAGANTFLGIQTFDSTIVGYVIALNPRAAGAGQRGSNILLGINTTDGAPGTLVYQTSSGSGGTSAYTWSDDSGVLRIKRGFSGDWPTGANRNTDGVAVGTQTSSLDAKDVLEELTPIDQVLAFVAAGAEAVRRFTYKSGQSNFEEFEGVIVDYAGRYGTDRDEEHPHGKSLNTVNATGDLLRAVDWLVSENAKLQGRLTALEEAT